MVRAASESQSVERSTPSIAPTIIAEERSALRYVVLDPTDSWVNSCQNRRSLIR